MSSTEDSNSLLIAKENNTFSEFKLSHYGNNKKAWSAKKINKITGSDEK